MVKVHMKDSKIWKTCISSIANLIDGADFKLTPEGIRMKAMDPSHVVLVDFELPKATFAEYDVKRPVVLGIDLQEMNKIMSRAKADDELTLSFDEEKNRLDLTFKGVSTRKFNLPLIDIKEADLPEPKLEFTASASVVAGAIQDGLRDAEIIGDNVKFELDKDEFLMRTESEKGATELKLCKGDTGLRKLSVDQPARAMFNINYLINMTKAASSSDEMLVNLGTNLPIQLNFQIAGKGRLQFLLAPRIEAE